MAGSRKKKRDGPLLPVPRREDPDIEGRDLKLRPSTTLGIAHFSEFELRRGPIPDAVELARYGQAHPDAPVIILEEFRLQGAHRRERERDDQRLDARELETSILSERIGVACALLIALVGFGCATFLVSTDHGVAGTVIFGLDVGALVSAFILGRPRLEPQHVPASGGLDAKPDARAALL